MSQPTTHTLEIPGARLCYEVRGSGPVLALVGQPMGAFGFAALADAMADDHTVVTYDPRGFGRSTIDDPDQDADPDLLADDVRRVLAAVTTEPAQVFGSSGGAVTGLAMVTRFGDVVARLVAHEPPVGLLLSDPETARAAMQDIFDTYRTEGIGAAWQRFGTVTGMAPGVASGAGAPAPSPAEVATSERFFAHGLLPIACYEPDLAALRAAGDAVVVGVGTDSRGQFPHRSALALAERLTLPVAPFPGGHVGFATDAPAFADVLRRALA